MMQAYQSYTVKALIPYLFPNNATLEFGIFDCFFIPLHPTMSHETGGGSESSALLGNL